MLDEILFFIEVTISGLTTGILYSLVAIGFVLIYKASGIFNFAQGAMVLFSAMFFAGMIDAGIPILLSAALSIFVMFCLAVAVEFSILRRMLNQTQVSLFMVTIGLSYILFGLGQLMWGSGVRRLDVGIPSGFFDLGGVFIDKFDLSVAVVCGLVVILLALFFQKTRVGRALRAVADDHQAAVSIGVPIKRVWIIVWSVAGVMSLITGIVWGSRLGVQPALNLVAMKALPVIVLGGLTSIPGAIVGGIIIGVSEKLFEVYLGAIIGGATEGWIAYLVAILFLLIKPSGLFGDSEIKRI